MFVWTLGDVVGLGLLSLFILGWLLLLLVGAVLTTYDKIKKRILK